MPAHTRVARITRSAVKKVVAALPPTREFDNAVHFLRFLSLHRRLPTSSALFSDRLHRLKTSPDFDNPIRKTLTDKFEMKRYVEQKLGSAYCVPTVALFDSLAEVSNDTFPARCCIKPTHMSGDFIIREDGEPLELARIRNWLATDYYRISRERNYRDLSRRVIVEPLVFNRATVEDFKIFCVHGTPRAVQIDFDRRTHHRRQLYDTEWRLLPYTMGFPRVETPIAAPATLPHMLSIAAILSEEFPFLRVDLYTDGRDILVGELTNCPGNGFERFQPRNAEASFSSLLFGNCLA